MGETIVAIIPTSIIATVYYFLLFPYIFFSFSLITIFAIALLKLQNNSPRKTTFVLSYKIITLSKYFIMLKFKKYNFYFLTIYVGEITNVISTLSD